MHWIQLISLVFCALIFSACTAKVGDDATENFTQTDRITPVISVEEPSPTILATVTPNPQCAGLEKADVIIKVNFAEGVEKDTSYETGFYLSPIMSNMRLARKDCDYQTGFTFEELKKIGEAEVGVRGYSDNKRRIIEGEPISVTIDSEGRPDIGNYIEVKIIN